MSGSDSPELGEASSNVAVRGRTVTPGTSRGPSAARSSQRWLAVGTVSAALVLVLLGARWWLGIGPFAPATPGPFGNGGGFVIPIALGTFVSASSGSGESALHYDNATVQSAEGGEEWSSFEFPVQNPSGGIVQGPLIIMATNPANTCCVAVYTFAASQWSDPGRGTCSGTRIGGMAPVYGGESLDPTSSVGLDQLGDKRVLIGQGRLSGTASFQIP